jgi:hypothetical protein
VERAFVTVFEQPVEAFARLLKRGFPISSLDRSEVGGGGDAHRAVAERGRNRLALLEEVKCPASENAVWGAAVAQERPREGWLGLPVFESGFPVLLVKRSPLEE